MGVERLLKNVILKKAQSRFR